MLTNTWPHQPAPRRPPWLTTGVPRPSPSIKASLIMTKDIISTSKTVTLSFKTPSTSNHPRSTPHRLPSKAPQPYPKTSPPRPRPLHRPRPLLRQDRHLRVAALRLATLYVSSLAASTTLALPRALAPCRSGHPKRSPRSSIKATPLAHKPVVRHTPRSQHRQYWKSVDVARHRCRT